MQWPFFKSYLFHKTTLLNRGFNLIESHLHMVNALSASLGFAFPSTVEGFTDFPICTHTRMEEERRGLTAP